MTPGTPPRLASRLLARLAGREDAPYVLSDLADEFHAIAARRGRAAAVRWYWRQALTSAGPLIIGGVLRARLMARLHARDAFRVFRRAPAMSAAIVATMGLGIGANTAVFSVVDAVLLRPLPYAEADRLVALWERTPRSPRSTVSIANLADYARLDAFDGLAAYQRTTAVVSGEVAPEEVAVERLASTIWDVLGVRPLRGRLFTSADAGPGAPPVVVVSESFWRQRLEADPAAVGATLLVDRVPRTVVGVLPSTFRALTAYAAPDAVALFLPMPAASPLGSRGDHDVRVVGRLRDGVTATRAQDALDRVSADLADRYPATNRGVSAAVAPLPDDIARGARTSLLVVLGAVALVLLIACVNVANLLLVWATGHQRDVAVRLALGATRGDIVAEYVVRGLLFGAAGGAAGIGVGVWVRDALVALAPPSVIPNVGAIVLNARVLGVALALALATGLVASLLPALQVSRRRTASTLRDGALAVVGARSVLRWRGALLTAEVAAAVVLALGAGLLVRSLILVDRVDLGFATDRVATMMVRLPAVSYPDADARLRFFESLRARLAALPGVESVAYANQFPMRGGWGGGMLVEAAAGRVKGEVDLQAVSPGYFATLGLHLRRGRTFTDADRHGAAGVAVVSETFVSRFLAGEDPVGRVIRRHDAAPPLTIVGVVAEVRRDGKFAEAAPQVYLSALQPSFYASDLAAVAVRTVADPLAIVPLVRQAVAAQDATLVVASVRTLDEILDASLAALRFHTWLLALLGALALVLSMVGVYGVVNYVVVQRTREMGLRLALGATRAQVMRVVIGGGLRWAAAGLGLGMILAAGASRVLSSLLFETAPHDATTFAAVAAIVGGVAFIAAWVPVRRAIAGDPVAALRGE